MQHIAGAVMSHVPKAFNLNSEPTALAQRGAFEMQERESLRGLSRANPARSPQEQISLTSAAFWRPGHNP